MTALTETTRPDPKSADPGVEVTMDASDSGSGNEATAGGTLLVFVHNTDASPQNFGITSQASAINGRTGDISESLAADEYRAYLLPYDGWADANGEVNFTSGSNNVKIGYMKLPSM